MSLLEVCELNKAFGGVVATRNVSLDVEAGEVHAIIGPNGAGKTTLVSQLCGDLEADSGTVHLDGRDISRLGMHQRARLGMARSFQITSIIDHFSVRENVMLPIQARCGHSFRFWRRVTDDPKITAPAEQALIEIGLGDRADTPATDLSHGERKQLEVAMAMAMNPKLLLLDEPMAGLGTEESRNMVACIKRIKGGPGVLLIEHDMGAVFALADRITVLVNGAVIASDHPAAIRDNEDVKAAYLGDEMDESNA
jgi:branched-chain amino acid transport system ATP-binding protein